MSHFWTDFWSSVIDIAAAITVLGVPYLVVSNRRRLPRFSFDFTSSNREITSTGGNPEFGKFSFSGSVRNQSLDPNSIQRIFLVVWRNKKRKSYLRISHGATITQDGTTLSEPIRFDGREGRKLDIVFEIALAGTVDARLATAQSPVAPGSPYLLSTYQYEVAFEDISGNLFDNHGILLNRTGMDLRWTIGNTLEKLRGGNPLPFFWHFLRIYLSDAVFFVRRIVRRLGI
jgi:hypothetical protein